MLMSQNHKHESPYSYYSRAKGGVAFLFNINFSFQIIGIYSEAKRFIVCDIKTERKCNSLASLYGPSDDEPSFFQDCFDHLRDFHCDDSIGGDFNRVM